MFKYLLLDINGYCCGYSILNTKIEQDNMILINLKDDENNYINRKYDIENKKWLDQYRQEEISGTLSQTEIQDKILLNTEYLVAIQEISMM